MFVVEIKRKLLTRVSTIIERTEGKRGTPGVSSNFVEKNYNKANS
jgi:hypothetical protein